MSPTLTAQPLADEHSVLLWQTCAYVEGLATAARARRSLVPAYDDLLQFLHGRLLPFLGAEERDLPVGRLRDERLTRLLLADHERFRADVDNIELARTRRLLGLATEALVARLDRHVHREESWVVDPEPARALVGGFPVVKG